MIFFVEGTVSCINTIYLMLRHQMSIDVIADALHVQQKTDIITTLSDERQFL